MSEDPFEADPFAPTALDEETELRALAQALEFSEGFKLIFVRCNEPQQRRRLAAELRKRLPEQHVQEIELREPVEHLLDALRQRIEFPVRGAVFVSGLEYSLPTKAGAEHSPFIANLNASRNSFPDAIPAPLVLWVPEYVLNALMLGAPDFFSIRSGVYFFAAAPGDTADIARSLTTEQWTETAGLTLQEKHERVEAIKSLLGEYEALPPGSRDKGAEARLHQRLQDLLWAMGDYDAAREHGLAALALAQETENREIESAALISLGNVLTAQGWWSEAAEAYSRSLVIARELNNHYAEASLLLNLGDLYRQQGRLDAAKEVLQQSLDIFRRLGDRREEGFSLNNLGIIYVLQEEWAEAEAAFRQSLETSETANDNFNKVRTLINLGQAYNQQKRFSEAESMLRQGLEIALRIGDRLGEAVSLFNLGITYILQGRQAEADETLRRSLAIMRQVGSRYNEGEILGILAALRAGQGDMDGATEYARQAVEVLEEVGNQQALTRVRELLAQLEREAEGESRPDGQ